MSASLAGARVAVWGEFSSDEAAQRCRAYALSNGATVCDLDAADLTHVIRGEITRRLAERLGATPRERELSRRGVILLEEAACAPIGEAADTKRMMNAIENSPFVLSKPQRGTSVAVSKVGGPPHPRDAAAPMDDRLRHTHAAALVARGTPDALAALAETLRDDGIGRSLEARAFAQLVSRGVSRFSRPAPFAAEFPVLRTRGADPHVERSRALGSVDSFCDDSGRRWCRVRFTSPSTYDTATVKRVVAFIELIAARRHARLWLAGFPLPAALGRDTWTALLATLAQR